MKTLYASLIVLCLGLGACTTPMPVETTYPLTYQQKMRSAHHWDVMAIDVANWLQDALMTPDSEYDKEHEAQDRPTISLYLEQPRYDSAAGAGFYDLLTTRLVERGFILTTNPSAGLPVSYDMQVVKSGLPETVEYEVIVNVSVMNADRYLIRYSNVYYVGDKSQYIAMQQSASRIIEVVGP
ncbi:MAG: hypothetical protein H6973_08600 [Gammaproteobacteria bacterium]|nr:hypothetical protein [Candidatus Competibacteraceae bacterium]MCP5125681.1 hypothetical protein [Gammaproteobacteria bacterium]HRX71152.1 hypothetical protein [Candidatus Competibacteraceae bacterium]